MLARPDPLPAVSVGLPVRNGSQTVRRCIESVLAQDYTDLELVVCDNASDDDTVETVTAYARADARVKLYRNPENIGSHENMNRVLDASTGRYFRWISSDDWIEPGYLSACVDALEARPDAIGVTTWFTIHTDDGGARYEEFTGEFPDSSDAARRFERMLWFYHVGDDAIYDPVYGLYRMDQLKMTGRVRPVERTDWLLSAELALAGPIIHVAQRLAHRTRSYPVGRQLAELRRRLDPHRADQLRTTPRQLSRALLECASAAELDEAQMDRCTRAARRFWIHELLRVNRLRAAGVKHGLLASPLLRHRATLPPGSRRNGRKNAR